MYLFNTITGDYMDKKRYKEIVDKHTPKENVIKNALVAFIVGGILGSLSELLLRGYMMWFNLPRKESGVMVILTLITIASVLVGALFRSKLVSDTPLNNDKAFKLYDII